MRDSLYQREEEMEEDPVPQLCQASPENHEPHGHRPPNIRSE